MQLVGLFKFSQSTVAKEHIFLQVLDMVVTIQRKPLQTLVARLMRQAIPLALHPLPAIAFHQ